MDASIGNGSRTPQSVSQSGSASASMISELVKNSIVNGGGNGQNAANQIKHAITYDLTTRFIPSILGSVFKWIGRRFQKRAERLCQEVNRRIEKTTPGKKRTGSVVIERNYKSPGDHNDMFDAVLAMASDLPQAKYVKRTSTGVFIVETKEEISLTPDIYFAKLKTMIKTDDDGIDKMVIEIFSYTQSIVHIRDFLTDLQESYMKNKKNQLGRQIYYFDEIQVIPPNLLDENGIAVPDYSKSPQTLTFSMFPLYTNKSLKNIYGASVQKAKKRVEFFANNPGWYRDKGIPYTLGILLHGVAGCGKTSFIKALSHDLGRHVVNIKLSNSTTVTQINNLFYSTRMSVLREGQSTSHDIPMDKRIIVIEDIDCLTNIVLKREPTLGSSMITRNVSNNNAAGINLSVLLNILDGVLETPGRIVIMTSNRPWLLDSALVRPGRIDESVDFTRCTPNDILDMLQGLGEAQFTDKERACLMQELPIDVWTAAEVTKVIFENIDRPLDAIAFFKRGKFEESHEIIPGCKVVHETVASVASTTTPHDTNSQHVERVVQSFLVDIEKKIKDVQVQSDAVDNEFMTTLTPLDTIDMENKIKDVQERARVAVQTNEIPPLLPDLAAIDVIHTQAHLEATEKMMKQWGEHQTNLPRDLPNYTRSNRHLDTSFQIDAIRDLSEQTKKETNMWAMYGLADVGEVQINPKKSTDKNAKYTPIPQPDPVASELTGCSVYTPLPDPIHVNVTSNESWYGIASGPTSSLNP